MGQNRWLTSVRDYYLVGVLFALFIGLRLLFLYFPFWGLEYEDSFIFNDTARYLSFEYDYNTMPYRCNSCLDGTYENCHSYGTLGGHFLTVSLLTNIIHNIFSYSTFNIFALNFTFSLLLPFAAYFSLRNDKNFSITSFICFITLLVVTPFVSIFHTSGLSETVSSFFVFLSFVFIYRSSNQGFKIQSLDIFLAILTISLSVATKRENLVLIVFLFCIPFLSLLKKEKFLNKGYIALLLSTLIMAIAFSNYTNLFTIESDEVGDIGSPTFAISFALENLTQLFLAIFTLEYWGLTGYIIAISILYSIYKKNFTKLSVYALTLTFLYILLYASHYRSYYQAVHSISHPFETLRYSTNYVPLLFLFVASLYHDISLNKERLLRSNAHLAVMIAFMVLSYNSYKTRILFSEDEYWSRIEPVESLLSLSSTDDIIISTIPLVYRCYSDKNQHIVDLFRLTNFRLMELIRTRNGSNIFLQVPKDMEIDIKRYNLDLDLGSFIPIDTTCKNHIIKQLDI